MTSFNQICGKFKLEFGLEFDSIIQLVDYYHRCADGLADILRIPLLPIPNRLDPLWLNSLAFKSNGQFTNQSSQHSNNVNNKYANSETLVTLRNNFCIAILFLESSFASFRSQAEKHSIRVNL